MLAIFLQADEAWVAAVGEPYGAAKATGDAWEAPPKPPGACRALLRRHSRHSRAASQLQAASQRPAALRQQQPQQQVEHRVVENRAAARREHARDLRAPMVVVLAVELAALCSNESSAGQQ